MSRNFLGVMRGPMPFRVWFTVAAIGSAGFALAIGIVAGWYSWQQQKLRLGQNLIATSRALVQSIDRELEQSEFALRALASSANLRAGDVEKFDGQAREILQPYGYFLILTEVGSSRELINTAANIGAPLPALPYEWTTGPSSKNQIEIQPMTQIFDGRWAVAVQTIGSTQTGSKKYVLTLGVPANRFQRLIDDQRLPPKWSPVFLDQNWIIVARAPEKFVGQMGANSQLRNIEPSDSLYEAHVLEGDATIHARSRSDKYGWTVAVAVPQALLGNEFLGPALMAGLSGFVISALAAGAIGLFSRWLGRDVDALAKATTALTERKDDGGYRFQISELANVAQKLELSAKALKAEEAFRKQVVDELAHRLRNKLATIQAIIGYNLRGHPKLRDEIFSRLTALSATDALIMSAQGRGAELVAIINAELAAYENSRIVADGPQIFLEFKLALSMALVLHELATNASKYGAFASARGKVLISWNVKDNRLHLQWRESQGPIVVKPDHHGFGSRLVTGILASLGGKIDAHFERAGLVCDLSVDLAGKAPNALPRNVDVPNQTDVQPSPRDPTASTAMAITNKAAGTAAN